MCRFMISVRSIDRRGPLAIVKSDEISRSSNFDGLTPIAIWRGRSAGR